MQAKENSQMDAIVADFDIVDDENEFKREQ